MEWLSQQNNTIFVGQGVEVKGTGISNSLVDIPIEKRLELPVMEDFQAGLCNGLALAGKVPICVYPRWNFALLAVNQIVNHLDKIPIYSDYRPKVIIRVGVGSVNPLHPQAQHVGDYSIAFKAMMSTIEVIRLEDSFEIFPAYKRAYERSDGRSTLLVEFPDSYNK